jgi:DnaJ-class molecular chaperone
VYRHEGESGDLIITLRLQLPQLNEKQKTLLKEMKDAASNQA